MHVTVKIFEKFFVLSYRHMLFLLLIIIIAVAVTAVCCCSCKTNEFLLPSHTYTHTHFILLIFIIYLKYSFKVLQLFYFYLEKNQTKQYVKILEKHMILLRLALKYWKAIDSWKSHVYFFLSLSLSSDNVNNNLLFIKVKIVKCEIS